jgi:hypothetical protein
VNTKFTVQNYVDIAYLNKKASKLVLRDPAGQIHEQTPHGKLHAASVAGTPRSPGMADGVFRVPRRVEAESFSLRCDQRLYFVGYVHGKRFFDRRVTTWIES